MNTKTQDQAQQYLQHLKQKTVPADGLPYAKSLFAIDLDHSDNSLAQLDALLTQLKRQGETPNSLIDQPGGENFIFMIIVFLIDVIATRTEQTAEWYNYHEARQKLPSDYDLPAEFFSSIVAMIDGNVCLPLGVLSDILHGNNTRTCVSYVEERCKAIEDAANRKDPNAWCKIYLEAFRNKQYMPGGNAYRTALELITFDDSLRSVQEIDHLLLAIKETEQLSVDDYAAFMSNTEKTNALLLIAFYLGMLVAKHTNNIVKWQSFDDFKQNTNQPDLEYHFEYHAFCVINNTVLQPLGVLSEILFEYGSEKRTCLDYVTSFIQSLPKGHLIYFPSHTDPTFSEEVLDDALKANMSAAGFLAATATFHVQDGGRHQPTKMILNDGKAMMVAMMFDDPVTAGLRDLEENRGQLPFQSFAYDSFANLPTGRTDAFTIEIRGYGSDAFALRLIVPYQLKDKDHDFQINSVVMDMVTPPFSPAKMQAAIEVFYEGAFGFISPFIQKSLWKECFKDITISPLDTKPATTEFLDEQAKRFIEALGQLKSNAHQTAAQPAENETTTDDVEAVYRDMIANLDVAELVAQLPLKYRSYLQVVPPSWMKGDELYSQITAMPTLYRTGKVVWAALIQANQLMFKPESASCPGAIIFDPTGQTGLNTLVYSARQLFALKGTTPGQADQLKYAQHLTNEHTRLMNYPFPQSLAPLPLRMSSIWFWRMHLPDGMLSLSYFPIIISEQCPGEAIVLPSLFWPQPFKDVWKAESIEKNNGQFIDLEETVFNRLDAGKQDLPDSLLEPRLPLIFSQVPTAKAAPSPSDQAGHNTSSISANKSQAAALYEQANQILDTPDLPMSELQKALEPLNAAAALGNMDAMLRLAYFYAEGILVEKNDTTSFDYLLKLAHRGDMNSCALVANYYLAGRGCEVNPHKSRYWLNIAAQKGYPDGASMLRDLDRMIAQADMAAQETEVVKPISWMKWVVILIALLVIGQIIFH